MMKTIIAMLEKMGGDVDYRVRKTNDNKPELVITIDDFEGFDENWSEVMRDYDENAEGALVEWLEEHCISEEGDLYSYYHFEDFDVQLGYTSFDI